MAESCVSFQNRLHSSLCGDSAKAPGYKMPKRLRYAMHSMPAGGYAAATRGPFRDEETWLQASFQMTPQLSKVRVLQWLCWQGDLDHFRFRRLDGVMGDELLRESYVPNVPALLAMIAMIAMQDTWAFWAFVLPFGCIWHAIWQALPICQMA
eukprot:s1444_g12.t1